MLNKAEMEVNMELGSKVKIKDTSIIAIVTQIGRRGLLMLSSKDLHAFDRNVYGTWEVEEVMENEITDK